MSKIGELQVAQCPGKAIKLQELSVCVRDGCGGTHELSLASLPSSQVLQAAVDLTDKRQRPSLPLQPQDLLLWTRYEDGDVAALRAWSTVELAQLTQVGRVLN